MWSILMHSYAFLAVKHFCVWPQKAARYEPLGFGSNWTRLEKCIQSLRFCICALKKGHDFHMSTKNRYSYSAIFEQWFRYLKHGRTWSWYSHPHRRMFLPNIFSHHVLEQNAILLLVVKSSQDCRYSIQKLHPCTWQRYWQVCNFLPRVCFRVVHFSISDGWIMDTPTLAPTSNQDSYLKNQMSAVCLYGSSKLGTKSKQTANRVYQIYSYWQESDKKKTAFLPVLCISCLFT